MIVEIGTADFRTQAGRVDGLFIEPVPERFNALPDCRKENIAISNFEGELPIYYIPLDLIEKHKMPNWIRGCSTLGHPHPTVVKMGYGEFVAIHYVKVERIKTVLDRHGIDSIEFLKIDTEGHDCVILNDYLDTVDFLPQKIQFEANELSDQKEIADMVKRLESEGYVCGQNKFDMICELL